CARIPYYSIDYW
nr:immunoglobulin heavy chain junction region [Macaca mulatta]MOX39977.1 immunoglobulin heavy chain junction region [Macaca mulatta]